MNLVNGLLAILSLDGQWVTVLFIVVASSYRSLKIELSCVLILCRCWVVDPYNGTCSKVNLIVSVTVCAVLNGIRRRRCLSVVGIHCSLLLGFNG